MFSWKIFEHGNVCRYLSSNTLSLLLLVFEKVRLVAIFEVDEGCSSVCCIGGDNLLSPAPVAK